MVKSRVNKEIDKIFNEVQNYIVENKDPKERNNFKRKQLQFLKADVHHPKIPFKRCMLIEKRKKERRLKSVSRKIDIGQNNFHKKK
jgi:hypothetical protein